MSGPAEPRTKREALDQAGEWGKTLSHWNEYCGLLDDRPQELALCARADLAEKERLIALAALLPVDLPLGSLAGREVEIPVGIPSWDFVMGEWEPVER